MSDKTPELLPCPDCGKPPGTKAGPPALARCITDGCPGTSLGAKTIAEWNTRPTPAERPVGSLTLAEQAIERQKVLGDPTGHVDALAADLVLAGETEYVERPVPQVREALADRFAKQFPAVLSQYSQFKIVDWFLAALTARPSDAADYHRGIKDTISAMKQFGVPGSRTEDGPSDAAVAWQQTLLECRDFLADLVSGASFEGRAINHAKELIEEADALLALPPDEPARVTDKGK